MELTYHALVSNWIVKADRMKDFFSTFRQRPSGSLVRGLVDALGFLQTDPDEVLSIAFQYFKLVFSAEVLTDDIPRLVRKSGLVCSLVSPSMADSLISPFLVSKLKDAVASLDASSCPGDDGLTRHFFLEFWDVIHGPLLRGIQHILDSGSMPSSLCSGLISLIPKGRDLSLLRQWRPITLLS